MNRVEVSLPDYLRPPCEDVWRWEENGDLIVWCSNPNAYEGMIESTAAFNPQLRSLLTSLNEHVAGLPPLSAVLMVLGACQDSWTPESSESRVAQLSGAAKKWLRLYNGSGPSSRLAAWLDSIRQLPKEMRSDVDWHLAILTYGLQDARDFLLEASGIEAADVLACVSVEAVDRAVNWSESASVVNSVARARRALETLVHMSNSVIEADAIRAWRRTQIGSLPNSQPPEIPVSDPIRRSLKELIDHQRWGGIAQIAVDAASVLSLPRRPSDPEVLPMGGVSDVTNRGEPERLLMTELAQEPIVMLARIACGQALYLRRETPPGPSPKYRPLLVEAGIRTWGVIRTKIAAMALAIAAAEEQRGETTVRVMTVAGRHCLDEDLTNPAGIVAFLERLYSDEHPGDAITNWLARVDEEEEPFADPILIVSAATDRDQRFRRCLDPMPSGYLVARVERDENVTLLRRTPLGDEAVQSLAVKPPVMAQPARVPTDHGIDSPILFLGLRPCPLRFTDHLDGSWVKATGKPGLLTVTRDRRLLWFDKEGCGAIELIERMPSHHVLADEIAGDRAALVVGRRDSDERHLVEVDLESGESRHVKICIGGSTSAAYVFDQGSLYRFADTVELIDRSNGTCVDRKMLGVRIQIGGCVLFNHSLRTITLVSHDGNDIVFREFPNPFRDGSEPTIAVRNASGMIVLVDKRLNRSAVLDVESVPANLRDDSRPSTRYMNAPVIEYQSLDGNTLIVRDGAGPLPWARFDFATGIVKDHSHTDQRTMVSRYDPQAGRMIRPRNLLTQISAITFIQDQIRLTLKRGRQWSLVHDVATGKLKFERRAKPMDVPIRFPRGVRPNTTHGQAQWSVRTVTIGDQSVTVDSRGFLHFHRADHGTEVTLVLHETHISGWASWGIRFGESYFTGVADSSVPKEIVEWLKEFARRCSQSN